MKETPLKHKYRIWNDDTKSFQIIESTKSAQEFTYVKDKRGKDIYNGDVLQSERGFCGTVIWNDHYEGWVVDIGSCDFIPIMDFGDHVHDDGFSILLRCEVIDNIIEYNERANKVWEDHKKYTEQLNNKLL